MPETIKILSWNVNGIRAMVKKGLYETVKQLDPDIFCIQETKAQDDIVSAVADGMNGYHVYSNSAEKKGYSGTAVFTRIKPISHSCDIGQEEHDREGRVITLEFDAFYLVNAYIPNSGQALKRLDYRKTWDEELASFISDLDRKKPVIFGGDFNVAHEPIDLARPKANYNKTAGYTQTEIDGFKKFMEAGLVDTFRYFHKDKIQYTFWNQRFRARENNVGWRIDYFLVSKRYMDNIQEAFILDDIMGSDHCPVGIKIRS